MMNNFSNNLANQLHNHLPDILPLLVREQSQKSFYSFFKAFWNICVPDNKGYFNWHIKYLCNEMQKIAERVLNNEARLHDLIINVPPGSTKSTICSVMFPAWIWTRMPSARIICVSQSNELSERFSKVTRTLLKSEL